MKISHKILARDAFIVFLVVIAIFISGIISTDNAITEKSTISDEEILEFYVERNYPGYDIVITDYDSIPEDRVSETKIYVEKSESVSSGNAYGYSDDGYYIVYNCPVEKGKTVISYCIYNPHTNYIDDVVAVVDNGEIRE